MLLLCLAYFGRQLAKTPAEVLSRLLDPTAVVGVLLGVSVYLLACLWLAVGWRAILEALGQPRIGLGRAISIYGTAQIGKYLPGNLFHLAGRQMLAVRAGVDSVAAFSALLLEHLSLLIAAGSMIPISDLWRHGASLGVVSAVTIWLGAPLLLAALGREYGRRRGLEAGGARSARWIAAWGCHLGFFAASGSLLVALELAVPGSRSPVGAELLLVGAAFAPAWILGLLTPGAPSGLGVREAVLFFALAPRIGDDRAVLLAIALRLVSSLGDLAFFAVARVVESGSESARCDRGGGSP